MRRSRFAKAVEVAEVRERASIRDALWFDITSPDSSDEESLCDWRLSGMQHAPIILGVTHLLITVAYLVLSPKLHFCLCYDNPLIPSLMALLVDAGVAGLMLNRKRIDLGPHDVFRMLCVYLAVAGLLWTWFGSTLADDAFVTPIAAAPIAMAAGIAMRTIVAISSPPLVFVNMVVSIVAAILLAGSPLVPAGIAILSLVLFAYHCRRAQLPGDRPQTPPARSPSPQGAALRR